MNQALFLKYRPQTFKDIVGQDSVVKTLSNALKANKPVHAYLFAGSRGTGKTSMARLLAKGLNCTDLKNGSPCGECKICKDTADGNLVDVIEIDAASNRGIDEIRDLREKVKFSPNITKRKVYIIDEVHMLTKDASNALLKTLEAPPEHAYFILATTELHKILDTIISRCQTFVFGRFAIEQLVGRLEKICKEEGLSAEKIALELIARKAEGGLRDAISALDQISAESGGKITEQIVRESLGISSSELLENFWKSIEAQDAEKGFEVLKIVAKNGADLRTFGHDFLGFLREKMFQNLKSREILAKLIPTIEEIEKALIRLKTSPITELPLEIAVVKLCSSGPPLLAGEVRGEVFLKKTKISRDSTPKPESIIETVSPETKKAPQQTTEAAGENNFVFDDEDSKTKTEKPSVKQSEIQDPAKLSSEQVCDISAGKIKEQMEEIANKANIPVFVKKSFLTTSPQIQGNVVTFCSASSFHYEQISSEKMRSLLQRSISEIFGKTLTVECSRGPGSSVKKVEVVATSDDLEF
jgi:DNA polymerase-3 subunit gamma/tau